MSPDARIVCRSIVANKFRTIPLRVYYIDMPGSGLPGSNITGTGTKEAIQAKYTGGLPQTFWRRDMYFWFDELLAKRRESHIMVSWDDMSFRMTNPAQASSPRTFYLYAQALYEDYSAAFSDTNLPSMSSSYQLLMTMSVENGSIPIVTIFEQGTVSPQIHIPLAFESGDVWGFRLSFFRVGIPTNIESKSISLGDFQTGDPNYDTWQWPDDVWCWIWERGQ